MNISWGRYWQGLINTLERQLHDSEQQFVALVSNLQPGLLRLSPESIASTQTKRLIKYQTAENQLACIRFTTMNSSSIWAGYNCTPPALIHSPRILPDLSSPLLRPNVAQLATEIAKVEVDENALFQTTGQLLQLTFAMSVRFVIVPTRLLIVWRERSIEIQNSELWLVLQREPSALEFVTITGRSYLIDFNTETRVNILKVIRQIKSQAIVQTGPSATLITGIKTEWITGGISNFEYLLKINFFGGRSYNSVSLYPIFPYLEKMRDLTIPLKINPGAWLKTFAKFPKVMDDETERELIEILAEQTIELTPEFFTMPEVLTGIKQPYEFVYDLRKQLESDMVSENLHLWIDAIFGIQSSLTEKVFRTAHPQKNVLPFSQKVISHTEFEIGHGILSFAVIDQFR
jgi:hypothetical protein